MNFILLAAGRGQRMGMNKALMIFNGEPWVQYQVRQIVEAGFEDILIVTNPESAAPLEEITFQKSKVQIYVNSHPEKGPFSSLQIAINENNGKSAFVSPMDAPLKASTLIQIKDAWHKMEGIEALIPSYKGQKGHPVVLSTELLQRLQKLPLEDAGSRLDLILRNLPEHKKKILEVEDPFIPLNLNTPEDLRALSRIT